MQALKVFGIAVSSEGCNRNLYNWNNIALNVHFEASQEDGHGYSVRLCRILHYDLKIQQADRN